MKNYEISKIIGERIFKRREEMGISQQILAEGLGYTNTSIINIEKGRQRMIAEKIYKMCCLLNMQPNDIFPPIEPYEVVVEKQFITKTVVVEKKKKKVTLKKQ